MIRRSVRRRPVVPAAVPSVLATLMLASLSVAVPVVRATQTLTEGKVVFEAKCAACHSLGTDRLVGPGLQDVTLRRDPDWLGRFISNPAPMLAGEDSTAVRLLAEYLVPMPDLSLTADEVDAVVAYLGGAAQPGPGPGAESPQPARTAEASPALAGDPAIGRSLFTGGLRLENGGPACVSCHSIGGLEAGGGGTLAKDLSTASTTYGPALASVLETTPFPLMRDIFSTRSLTSREIADLSALLEAVAAGEPGPASASTLLFPLSGLGGTILLLLLAGFVWKGRLNGVRKPLIGGHR